MHTIIMDIYNDYYLNLFIKIVSFFLSDFFLK